MTSQSISAKNDLYLEKMCLTDEYVKLYKKLEKELDLANLCISKAKTTHGISLFSVNSYDSHDLEPSVRILNENGKFELEKEPEEEKNEEKDEGEEELKPKKSENDEENEEKTKNSGEVEDVEGKKSRFAGQFRPFGVLESTAAKDARKTMKQAIETLLQLATIQQSISAKVHQLTEDL